MGDGWPVAAEAQLRLSEVYTKQLPVLLATGSLTSSFFPMNLAKLLGQGAWSSIEETTVEMVVVRAPDEL
jgi:hypothetical protein